MKVMTDGAFSRARIKNLDGAGMRQYLNDGEVIVATGFQGIDDSGNITTLGRGGSDTSALPSPLGLMRTNASFSPMWMASIPQTLVSVRRRKRSIRFVLRK